jgi:hypothetical protein
MYLPQLIPQAENAGFHFTLITRSKPGGSMIASILGLLKMNLNKMGFVLFRYNETGMRVCKIFTGGPKQYIPQMNFFSGFEKSFFFQILPPQP